MFKCVWHKASLITTIAHTNGYNKSFSFLIQAWIIQQIMERCEPFINLLCQTINRVQKSLEGGRRDLSQMGATISIRLRLASFDFGLVQKSPSKPPEHFLQKKMIWCYPIVWWFLTKTLWSTGKNTSKVVFMCRLQITILIIKSTHTNFIMTGLTGVQHLVSLFLCAACFKWL